MPRQYAKQQPAGFKNRIEKIAIVGAGGQIGSHVVNALLAEGKHTITAITREGSTNELPAGVAKKVVPNYDDQPALIAALQGQDAFIITMSVEAPPDSSAKLIEAAAAAKVPWVMPNEFGTDPTPQPRRSESLIGNGTWANRELMQKLGLSFVAISCSFWFEYSLSSHPVLFGFDIPKREVTFYDDGKTLLSTSSKPFCGLAAAKVLGLNILPDDESDKRPCIDDFRNRSVNVASFTVSQRDMLDAIQRVTDTKDSDWTISYEPVKQRYADGIKELQGGNRLGFGKALYARLFYPDDGANFPATVGLDNAKLGLQATEDFDAWTKIAVDLAYQPSRFRPAP